ncbi:MAG: hypothetical protein WDZ35_11055 [Crocinitomicaceae bacterium]
MHKQRLFILIAAGVGLLGVLLPWATWKVAWMSGSVNGFSPWEGWATIAGLGAAAGILFKAEDRNTAIDAATKKIVLGGGAAAFLFPLIFIIRLSASSSGAMGSAMGFGIGVFLALLAGLAIVAIPFAIKADGEFEMPSKDSINKDIKEIKGEGATEEKKGEE